MPCRTRSWSPWPSSHGLRDRARFGLALRRRAERVPAPPAGHQVHFRFLTKPARCPLSPPSRAPRPNGPNCRPWSGTRSTGSIPAERDVILLSLGHDLHGDELAEALGISRNDAHALLSRGRSQLERSLGALIVARAGGDACTGLDAILAGWDGQMTVLMRKRISRHIERCEICGDRKRRELTPALLAGMAPLAALAPGFRSQLLRVLADRTPSGVAHRLSVANRASPFGPSGFPGRSAPTRPHHGTGSCTTRRPSRTTRMPAPAGAATTVAAAGVVAVVFIVGAHHGPSAAVAARGRPQRGG